MLLTSLQFTIRRENISRRKQNLVACFSQRLRFEMFWIAMDVLISTRLVAPFLLIFTVYLLYMFASARSIFQWFSALFDSEITGWFSIAVRKKERDYRKSTNWPFNEIKIEWSLHSIDNYAKRIKTMVEECFPRVIMKSCFMASIFVPDLSFFRNDIVIFFS